MNCHFFKFILSFAILYSGVLLSLPNVTGVNPVSGNVSGGNLVTISGTGFTGTSSILFGNKPVGAFVVIDDTTIQAVAPVNSPGVNQVRVNTPSGTSPLNPPLDYYTYQGDWLAFIPNFGSNNVYPINVATQVVAPPIPVGALPNSVAITPDGKIAVCVNSGSNSISLIDVATLTVFSTISILPETFPILAITPDGQTLAIVNYSSNSVTLMNMNTFGVAIVPVGVHPTSIAIVPHGNLAYVTNTGSSSLTQINLDTLATLTIPGPAGSIPSFIEITPNGTRAIVTDSGNNVCYVFNPITLAFEVQIPGFSLMTPNLFPQVGITPDGTTAWVANTGSNTISSIIGLDTNTPTFGSSIIVGSNPNGLAITPDGKQAYVTNSSSNNVSIVTFASASSVTIVVGQTPTNTAITADQAPVAYFAVAPGLSGQPSFFNASASLSPVGTIISYEWNFGDGSPVIVTNMPMISHTYAQSGIFSVSLRVTNSAGTSLIQNFTGQLMLNNGGPSALASAFVTILPTAVPIFIGNQCADKFATQTDYVNRLFWTPSSDPAVIGYRLFRNGSLIAIIPASAPLIYDDHNRTKNQADVYTLVAFDQFGLTSSAVTIIVE